MKGLLEGLGDEVSSAPTAFGKMQVQEAQENLSELVYH